jgi:hypothetical protein
MEILYFSLGAFAVALSYAVVSVFKLNKTELAREVATAQDELYRFVDSRVDKLEDRLTKNS